MTRITVQLPDDLAEQAKAAGLLEQAAVERLLRRALSDLGASDRLAAVFAKLDAQGEAPMSETDVAEEIAAARRDRAARR